MQAGLEVVREIVDALNRGDVDGMLAHMHPDFEWRPLESSPVARVYRGHADVRRYVEDWLTTFECLRIDLEDPVEVGDCVVAMARGRARGRASGVESGTLFCQVWTVRDGTAIGMEEHATREQGRRAAASPHVGGPKEPSCPPPTQPTGCGHPAGR
jgi:ketosteroid isomerase-like protein